MSYQFEWRHWRYFLAVAEELHFKKAADRLFISQPGLSRQIKELEEGIGVKLFERTNRKVALTKAGDFLKGEVTLMTRKFDHVLEHAKLLQEGLMGDVRLGYVGSAMQRLIPEILLTFKTDHSNVLFNLKEMEVEKQLEALLHHDLDIGFVRLDVAPPKLEMLRLLEEPFCLVLPSTHSINVESFESLSQFKEEHFILFNTNYSRSYYQKVYQIFDDAGFSPIVAHKSIHASSIFKLVENGLGISIIPQSLALEKQDNIKFIPLEMLPQRTSLSAIWNTQNKNPALAFIVELLKKGAL